MHLKTANVLGMFCDIESSLSEKTLMRWAKFPRTPPRCPWVVQGSVMVVQKDFDVQ
jgi:hypothetical protein